jgi:hypothetical protein
MTAILRMVGLSPPNILVAKLAVRFLQQALATWGLLDFTPGFSLLFADCKWW